MDQFSCRQGPLDVLAKELIPGKSRSNTSIAQQTLNTTIQGFFLPSQYMRLTDTTIRETSRRLLGDAPVTFQWDCIDLNLALSDTFGAIDDKVKVEIPDALDKFQRTFPDRYGFRSKVIQDVIAFQQHSSDQVSRLVYISVPCLCAHYDLSILSSQRPNNSSSSPCSYHINHTS